MSWYRQYPSKGLDLIFFSRLEGIDVERLSVPGRFSSTRQDKKSFPLTITDLHTNDSAVYYCASSTQHVRVINALINTLYVFSEYTEATVVRQAHSALVFRGESVHLKCEQEGSDQRMYWYRQYPSGGLDLIFFSNIEGAEVERLSVPERFSAARPNRQSFPLTITDLQTNDSAVYYCASSTQLVGVM
ncbi:TVB4 protein, partial [Polyodon spathula]|nr:TVB4 protein [Polyodon spathula]